MRARASRLDRVLIPETVGPLGLLEIVGLVETVRLGPPDGRLRSMKRTAKIKRINRLKWTKKTMAHLLLDLRHVDRREPGLIGIT